MGDLEERVRERAYRLWQQEGCPAGRELDHWEQARELVAIEENYKLATIPVAELSNLGPLGEPVEPILAVENSGEFPTLTDQGEERTAPKRRRSTPTAGQAGNRKKPRQKVSEGRTSAGHQ